MYLIGDPVGRTLVLDCGLQNPPETLGCFLVLRLLLLLFLRILKFKLCLVNYQNGKHPHCLFMMPAARGDTDSHVEEGDAEAHP